MKALALLATALITIAPFAPGQGVQPPPQRIRPAGIPGQPIPEPDSTPLIRLNFKGGKVKEFVDAVSQALKASTGKPDAIANVFIPADSHDVVIPAIDVQGVSVSQLFTAVSMGSQREVATGTPMMVAGPGRAIQSSIQYSVTSYAFQSSDTNGNGDQVWTFVYQAPRTLPKEPEPPQEVRYFQVAQYLNHFTVEDITTAVEKGWEIAAAKKTSNGTATLTLQNEKGLLIGAGSDTATLTFHDETGLLIGSGSESELKTIDDVLKQLTPALAGPTRSEREAALVAKKSREAAASIILPKITLVEATGPEFFQFVAKKTAEISNGKFHVRYMSDPSSSEKISLEAASISLTDLLDFATAQFHLPIEYTKDGVNVSKLVTIPIRRDAPRAVVPEPVKTK